MKILQFLLVLSFSLTTHLAQAQSNSIEREVGLRLSGFNNFGAVYKKKLADNKYRRITAGAARVNFFHLGNDSSVLDFGFAFSIGKEKRKPISEQLQWIRGTQFLSNLGLTAQSDLIFNLDLGVGFLMGLQYDFEQPFLISLEIVPAVIAYMAGQVDGAGVIGIRGQFDMNSVALTVAHRF